MMTFNLFSFQYLGCVEVFNSRGMEVCEEAIKVLKVSTFNLFIQTFRILKEGFSHTE